jgi:hypothetical protein
MKKLSIILSLACLLLAGCGPKELSKDEALELLKSDKKYPRVIDYDIFTADPVHAKRALDKGLEAAGLLKVERTQTLSEIGNPLILFTEKAKPYFLPAAPGQRASVQKVKIAEENIKEVKEVIKDYLDKSVVVVYTTEYTNITPFSTLLDNGSEKIKQRTADFHRTDDGWVLEKHK